MNKKQQDMLPLHPSNVEGDKIRKAILEHIKGIKSWEYFLGISKEQMIDWLEKQGEQKPVAIPKFRVGDFVKDANYHGEPTYEIVGMDGECYICQYRGNKSMGDRSVMHFCFDNPYLRLVEKKPVDLVAILKDYFANTPKEQQDKDWEELKHLNNFGWKLVGQKPVDEVEPKFHEGDWVVDKDGIVKQILSYKNGVYKHTDGYSAEIFEDEWRMWDITKDAKDGDVLATKTGGAFIYKGLFYDKPFAYCGVDKLGVFKDCNCGAGLDWTPYLSEVTPATKEQRDLLFKKMHEAGYEWDAEKKELKKIEHKPCMIQWKGDNLKEVIDFTGKDKNFDKWFKSFEEYEKYVHEHDDIFKLFNEDGSHYEVPVGAWIVKTPDGRNVASKAVLKQKPWSEADEDEMAIAIAHLFKDCQYDTVDWLKSLKSRVKPQPKQEWSKEDEKSLCMCLGAIGNPNYCYEDGDLERMRDFLKNLISRVQPQPKQEWNEEDERLFQIVIDILDRQNHLGNISHTDLIACVRKLKDLKDRVQPQTTWKPSDEQIGALEHFVRSIAESGFASPYDSNTKLVYSLLSELKKLRED